MTTSAPGLPADKDPLDGTAYRTIGHLGSGGMGEVLEAEHRELGHRVAVKLLHADLFPRFDLKERMRVEAQTCARLRHDNLVQVNDFGETADLRTFIVMERLHGRSLTDEMKLRGALPVAEAVDVLRQLLSGLSLAHSVGLVHRDIKPDNVFLCEPGEGRRRVKLLDFGLAKIIDVGRDPRTPAPPSFSTAQGLALGTPRYFSPEQASGKRDIDARSDLYSVGWLLHAMLTGKAPYPGRKTLLELVRAHAQEPAAPPSAQAPQPIPPELDVVVMKAIAKARDDRFRTAEDFLAALGPAVSTPKPTVALPSQVVQTAIPYGGTVDVVDRDLLRPVLPWEKRPAASSPVRGRNRAWLIALIGLLMVVFVAVTIRFFFFGSPP